MVVRMDRLLIRRRFSYYYFSFCLVFEVVLLSFRKNGRRCVSSCFLNVVVFVDGWESVR